MNDFDRILQQAIAQLPEAFRRALEEDVRVEVRDRPSRAQLRSVGLGEDELLLGLYEGVPLTERSSQDSGRLPDVIHLFRDDLIDATDDDDQLAEEIRITLLHELGHYFGMDESQLDELGYA